MMKRFDYYMTELYKLAYGKKEAGKLIEVHGVDLFNVSSTGVRDGITFQFKEDKDVFLTIRIKEGLDDKRWGKKGRKAGYCVSVNNETDSLTLNLANSKRYTTSTFKDTITDYYTDDRDILFVNSPDIYSNKNWIMFSINEDNVEEVLDGIFKKTKLYRFITTLFKIPTYKQYCLEEKLKNEKKKLENDCDGEVEDE